MASAGQASKSLLIPHQTYEFSVFMFLTCSFFYEISIASGWEPIRAPMQLRREWPMNEEILSRNVLIAALEKSSGLGPIPSGENVGDEESARAVAETVALIEDATSKIVANDLGAVEALFARQALALDVIFNQHAKQSARHWDEYDKPIYDHMRVALRAQVQCRSTLESLMTMKTARARDARRTGSLAPTRAAECFGERTV